MLLLVLLCVLPPAVALWAHTDGVWCLDVNAVHMLLVKGSYCCAHLCYKCKHRSHVRQRITSGTPL